MRVFSVPVSVPFLRTVIAALGDGRLVDGFRAATTVCDYGSPEFTNEVQHFRLEVLPWGGTTNSFPWKIDARLPGFLPMAARSANRGSSGSLAINGLSGAEPQSGRSGGVQTQLCPAAGQGTALEGIAPGTR